MADTADKKLSATLMLSDGREMQVEQVFSMYGAPPDKLSDLIWDTLGVHNLSCNFNRPETTVTIKMRPTEHVILAVGRPDWTKPASAPAPPPDPVEVILTQRDKLVATLRDERMRVWTYGLAAIFVAALREAGREDDDTP